MITAGSRKEKEKIELFTPFGTIYICSIFCSCVPEALCSRYWGDPDIQKKYLKSSRKATSAQSADRAPTTWSMDINFPIRSQVGGWSGAGLVPSHLRHVVRNIHWDSLFSGCFENRRKANCVFRKNLTSAKFEQHWHRRKRRYGRYCVRSLISRVPWGPILYLKESDYLFEWADPMWMQRMRFGKFGNSGCTGMVYKHLPSAHTVYPS